MIDIIPCRYFRTDEYLACCHDPDKAIVGKWTVNCGECNEPIGMDASHWIRGDRVPGLMRWTGEEYVDAYTGAFLGRPGDARP